MQYRIVKTNSGVELSEIVEELLEEGWKLQGGASVNESMYTGCGAPQLITTFAQAMTKETK